MDHKLSSGYGYAFGAAFALSASFIFSKSALNSASMIQFGVVWFFLGVIWNGTWYIFRYRSLPGMNHSVMKWRVAIGIAVLEAIATGLFYIALRAMENPAIVSFIGNIGPVFVAILGFTLLHERFKRLQSLGILVTLAGIFVINYRTGGFGGFLDPGAIYVIMASLFFSLATILGRRYHSYLVPELMSWLRSGILALVFILLIILTKQSLDLSISTWRNLALGSLFETLLTIVFAYQALRRIEATKTSLIISSKGVWTLLLAWLFLGVFPTAVQLTGGIITLVGVWMITWSRGAHSRG